MAKLIASTTHAVMMTRLLRLRCSNNIGAWSPLFPDPFTPFALRDVFAYSDKGAGAPFAERQAKRDVGPTDAIFLRYRFLDSKTRSACDKLVDKFQYYGR